MNILIIEAYTDGNIGSAALVENSIRLLKKNFPQAKIKLLAQFPEHVEKFSGYPSASELIAMPFKQARVKQYIWLIKTVIWMTVHALALLLRKIKVPIPHTLYTFDKSKLQALNCLAWAEIVVSIGAERINDNFVKSIFFSLYMLWCAKLSGKFLVLFPMTIGPFHFSITKLLSRAMLNHCDVIFLRDQRSYDTVKELSINKPYVISTCDVAVQQVPAPVETISRLFGQLGLPDCPLTHTIRRASPEHSSGINPARTGLIESRPLVGFSVMKWSYRKAQGPSRYEDYKLAIARAVDYLIENAGVSIVLLATNVPVHGCREDDTKVIRELKELITNKSRVYAFENLLTPAEIKGLIGQMEMCLTTRMHACIFSTGICTPTVTINYQFKLKEYMKLLGLENYTLDIDLVNPDNLKELVAKGWQDRQRIREQLEEKMVLWRADLQTKMQQLPGYYREKTGK
jgi:polysaccharide pyruvyl transferase WcaK-like protein